MKRKHTSLRLSAVFSTKALAPLAIVAALLACALPARAYKESAMLKLSNISIAEKDSISTFDITFTFDISRIEATYPDKELGICCTQTLSVRISESDYHEFSHIDAINDYPTDGRSENFRQGNTLTFHFNDAFHPHKGVHYTYKIGAIFKVFEKGSLKEIEDAKVDFGGDFMTPSLNMVFTVYGGENDYIFYESCPIEKQLIESLEQTGVEFSHKVAIADGAKVYLMRSGKVNQWEHTWTPNRDTHTPICEATSVSIDPENPAKVLLTFPKTEFLRGSGDYMICWEEGAFLRAESGLPCRERYIGFQGCKDTKYAFLRATDNKNTFEYATLCFNLPEGFSFGSKETAGVVDVFEGSSVEQSAMLSQKLRVQPVEGTPNALRVPLRFAKTPGATYTLHIPAGKILLYDADGKESPLYSNALVRTTVTICGRDKVEMPEIVWNKDVYNTYYTYKKPETIDPEAVGDMQALVVPMDPWLLEWDGATYCLTRRDSNMKGLLYEVTDEGDVLISDDCQLLQYQASTVDGYFYAARVWLERSFYLGHTYKVVIPEGAYSLKKMTNAVDGQATEYINFILSPEYSYTFKGAVDPTVTMSETTLEEGAVYETLENCYFTFVPKQTFTSGAKTLLIEGFDAEGALVETRSPQLTVTYTDATKTVVGADLRESAGAVRAPWTPTPGLTYKLTIPEGTFEPAAPELSIPGFSMTILAPEKKADDPKQDGIESIAADGTVEVWNLQGISLGSRPVSSLSDLPSGCYIIRSKGKTVKITI